MGITKVTAKTDNGDLCIYYSTGTYCSRKIKMIVAAPRPNTRRLLSVLFLLFKGRGEWYMGELINCMQLCKLCSAVKCLIHFSTLSMSHSHMNECTMA